MSRLLPGVGGSGRRPSRIPFGGMISLHASGVAMVLWSVVLLCVGATVSGAMVSCVMVSGSYGE